MAILEILELRTSVTTNKRKDIEERLFAYYKTNRRWAYCATYIK